MIAYDMPPAPIVQCVSCNSNEQKTLEFLQKRGIRSKNALATVMGNIKQESNFLPDICEGGARVKYHQCHSGGFGLIQWTSTNRYLGLGRFAKKYGGDPSTLSTQLRYMVNENQWQKYELYLKSDGLSVKEYMNQAWYWLGWGIHGYRTKYAYDYLNKFQVVVPDVNRNVANSVPS